MGTDTSVGTLWSSALVELGSGATIEGDLLTTSTPEFKSGAVVLGETNTAADLTPMVSFTWSTTWDASEEDVRVPSHQVVELAPGSYDVVTAEPKSTLLLEPGSYFINTLITKPKSVLNIAAVEQGPIVLYVVEGFRHFGATRFEGRSDQFAVVYLGSEDAQFRTDFVGTVIAPRGAISLGAGAATMFKGTFIGKAVTVGANVTVTHEPFAAWDFLLPPIPTVECVDSVGGNKLSARFGYRSSLDVETLIPTGTGNQVTPEPLEPATVPTTFAPGVHESVFRAVFPVDEELTWQLRGQSAVANSHTPSCPILPPAESPPARGDGPGEVSSKIALLDKYFVGPGHSFFSKGFGDPLSPTMTGGDGPEVATVRVHVTNYSWGKLGDACGGGSAPFVNIDIGDQGAVRRNLPSCGTFDGCFSGFQVLQPPPYALGQPIPQAFDPEGPNPTPADPIIITTVERQVEVEDSPVPVKVTVKEDDSFLCGGDDDFISTHTFDVDVTHSAIGPTFCREDEDGGACYHVEVIGGPPAAEHAGRICVNWDAQFVDEGFGEDNAGPYPAAFAEYQFVLSGPRGSVELGGHYDAMTGSLLPDSPRPDFLDENGCVPEGRIDPDLFVHTVDDSDSDFSMHLRVRTRLVGDRGTTYTIRDPSATFLVVEYSTVEGHFDLDSWEQRGPWALPPERIVPSNPSRDPLINTAAVLSSILAAEDNGLVPQTYPVVVGTSTCVFDDPPTADSAIPCTADTDCAGIESRCIVPMGSVTGSCGCVDDADCLQERVCVAGLNRCGVEHIDSCFSSPTLFVGPATLSLDSSPCTADSDCPGAQECSESDGRSCAAGSTCQCRWPDQSRWKYVTAHEAGHQMLSPRIGVTDTASYLFTCPTPDECPAQRKALGFGPTLTDPPDMDEMCACQHVTTANAYHCLQSVERFNSALSEGLAQFYAAKVFNSPQSTESCTFVYYKDMLLDACPGPEFECAEFRRRDGTLRQRVLPPIPVSCGEPSKWRNNFCGAPGRPDDPLLTFGTELDHMQFLWAWHTLGEARASMFDMTNVILQACSPEACFDTQGQRIPACLPPLCGDPDGDGSFDETPRLSWNRPSSEMYNGPTPSLLDGATLYLGDDSEALDHFVEMGRTRGIDEDLTP